jgi:hypothetical protein
MKAILGLALISVLGFGSSARAAVVADECMNKTTCTTAVTVDSGSAKTCKQGTSLLCACETARCGGGLPYYLSTTGSCNANYMVVGLTITGRTCCMSDLPCPPPPQASASEQIVESTSSQLVSDAFAPHHAESFWGVYGTTNRSPNTGRATSIAARLDICIGSTDVDTAVANGVSWCQNTGCGAAANEYCEAYGTNNGQTNVFAAVCKDRCECMINGTTHSTCDQL